MTVPTTRATFKDYCLKRLGKPVIRINVSDDQVDDRVDDAIKYWQDYHYDATERIFVAHQVTDTDISNKYLTVPDAYLEVMRVMDPGMTFAGSAFFNVKYQFMLHEVWDFGGHTILPYYVAMMHIDNLDDLLGDKLHFTFNPHTDKLRIETNWDAVSSGNYFVYEALASINTAEMWGDRWLQRYATALVKRQWGENLKKFNEVTLLGGVTFNGQTIYEEAVAEIATLEQEMLDNYSAPPLPGIA